VLVVALTGNYGMGKTLVLRAFRELGAFTMNADIVVSELLEDKDVLERLRQILGDGAFDKGGKLDRKRVSDMIFRDSTLRHRVEDVLHPLVFEKFEEALKDLRADVAVIEVPVVFERGYENRFSKTITVHTDEATALQRLAQKGIDREEALGRLRCQMPIGEKTKRADFSIDNGGSIEETKKQVKNIYDKLVAFSRSEGVRNE
jgi:dephospho-CoA kinase